MNTKSNGMTTGSSRLICALVGLFFLTMFTAHVHAALRYGLFESYAEFMIYNEMAERESAEWVVLPDGTSNLQSRVSYKSGYGPEEDFDSDGLLNIEEFDGWSTVINGYTGWFTCNVSNLTADVAHFGFGPSLEQFDSDCDGISDYYESDRGPALRTNPRSGDTDGDGLPDALEIYAGLNPCDDGYVYTKFVYTDMSQSERMMDPVITNQPVMTLQHPNMDIDGDGFSTKKELKKALDKYSIIGAGCLERTEHFPWTELESLTWTSPFDYDSDSDGMIDSYEWRFKARGFDPTTAETKEDAYFFRADPDKDGLTNYREQALHPLIGTLIWSDDPIEGDETTSETYRKTFVYGDSPVPLIRNPLIGSRYSARDGKGRIFNATVGYLQDAKYGKFGDQAPYFTVKTAGDFGPYILDTNGLPQITRAGVPGPIHWPAPATYWTDPRPIPDPGADSDGDGLPDGWEVEYGLNPLSGVSVVMDSEDDPDPEADNVVISVVFGNPADDPSGALGDPDGDGLTNYEEYFGVDGYRLDLITGTADESNPWIARSMNYPNQSSFETYLLDNWVLLRGPWQSPMGFDLVSGLDVVYSPELYPGFFNPVMYQEEVENWINLEELDPDTSEVTVTFTNVFQPKMVPTAGVPPFPIYGNDMATLAQFYGDEFVATMGTGGFQPFATAYGSMYYYDHPDVPDGRYTPGWDAVWVMLDDVTAVVFADPHGLFSVDPDGYPEIEGRPLTDNVPLMVPMPGYDTDSDGISDGVEVYQRPGKGRQPTSPVISQSPLLLRSAKFIAEGGSQTLFVDDPRYFSRDFTVEAWVYLDGDEPSAGYFIQGYYNKGGLSPRTLSAYELGIRETNIDGLDIHSVPYIQFHTQGGVPQYVEATRPLPRNRWVHLAGVFDHNDNRLSLVIDGTLESSEYVGAESISSWMTTLRGSSDGMGIILGLGADNGEVNFANRLWLDEVRIWGVAQSFEAISQNRNIILTPRQAVEMDDRALNGTLLAYYNFNDASHVAVDHRHRAMVSLMGYDFPASKTVMNRLFHEYLHPDLAYALPDATLGGGFIFDGGRVAPVRGAVDSQRGEYDSDGDGLPDSWELMNGMNPYAWYTVQHKQMPRYDAQWGRIGSAEVLIGLNGRIWRASADGGTTWQTVQSPLITTVQNGVVVTSLCPNTVIIGAYTNEPVTTVTDEGVTNTVDETVTIWEITSGQAIPYVQDGEVWWFSQSGVPVAPLGTTGTIMSDATSDFDGDGLTTIQEYWARTNPRYEDSDQDGLPDGAEDFDYDGLTNRQEALNGTRPDLADTDDDGAIDPAEVKVGTDGTDSRSPKKSVVAYFNGLPGSYLEVQDRADLSLNSWTIEAKVLPARHDYLPDGHGSPVFRRLIEDTINGFGIANYELRVVRDGDNLYPEARFVYKVNPGKLWLTALEGAAVKVRGTTPLPVSDVYAATNMTHLVATYDGASGQLSLFVNGELAGTVQERNITAPRNGKGPSSYVRIGERFNGFIDDVRLWSTAQDVLLVNTYANELLQGNEANLVAYYNFDDGGWPIIASNNWATEKFTNMLYSVLPATKANVEDIRDGETWVDGGAIYINESGIIAPYAAQGAIFDGTGIALAFGSNARDGDFGWNEAEKVLYRYRGGTWRKWGPAYKWLSPARAMVRAEVASVDDIFLSHRPTTGDLFICPADAAVYMVGLIDLVDQSAVVEMEPLLDGHRFYIEMTEAIKEWNADIGILEYIATASDEDGLYIYVQNEGLAYKSEDKVWRRWGTVPSTEDYTKPMDWNTEWAHAAKMSGVVQFLMTADSVTNYVPSGGTDTDGDGLPDTWELRYGLNPEDGGFGGVVIGSGMDIDGDGRVDYVYNPSDFINGAWGDPDNDGLNNRAEWLAGTHPMEYDTLGTGRSDYDSPLIGASFGSLYMDGDDIPDAWESLFPTAMSPLRYDAHLDPDGDGWDNYSEYMAVWKTRTANEYTVTTNSEGVVSSNWTSGSGYSIPYTLPDDPTSYPLPSMKFMFKTDCPTAEGVLRIEAFSSLALACPDATLDVNIDDQIRDGSYLTVTDWGTGHLRQGINYFVAFIDSNNNGQWDKGELLGFSEYMPENISWGEAEVEIALRETPSGLLRASWTEVAATNDSIRVQIIANSVSGQPEVYNQVRSGCARDRQYLHEWDLRAAGITSMRGTYTWRIYDGTNLVASGTETVNTATSIITPAIMEPFGNQVHASGKIRMQLDPAATDLDISIQTLAGQNIWTGSVVAPYVTTAGIAEMDMPVYAGFDSFTNGQYKLTIRAKNAAASSSIASSLFTVDIQLPANGGAGVISGRIHYYGWAASTRIVVEAFTGSGFDQRPVAKVLADRLGNYELRGLPIGDYYVRAFHDYNGNGVLDSGEAWGLVKGEPDTLKAINWGTVVIRSAMPKGGVSEASAASIYAVDYSAKKIRVRSLSVVGGNDLVLHDADTDNDGLPDVWEYTYAGNLTIMDSTTDYDGDGLLDIDEYRLGTNPTKVDTDGDGLSDGAEVHTYGTNPLLVDTDGDGLSDGDEVKTYGTDPLRWDTDGDGLSDREEIQIYGTNPTNPDTDGDGMPDGYEVQHGLNPSDPSDATGDLDNDGLSNLQEYQLGTDPSKPDTDGDGLSDGDEVNLYGTNPLRGDTDGDGLSDGEEVLLHGTDPLLWDTDGDGFSDGVEVEMGTDPLDPTSYPASITGRAKTAIASLTITNGVVSLVYDVQSMELDPSASPKSSTNALLDFQTSTNLLDTNGWSHSTQTIVSKTGIYTNRNIPENGNGILFIRIISKSP